MKYTLKTKAIGALVCLAALIGTAYGALFWNNLTWLQDPNGVVTHARLVGSFRTQEMTRLPWGTYVANTGLEGEVGVTCVDGAVTKGGYVTRNSGETFTVTKDCQIKTV